MGGYSDKCPICRKWYTDRGRLAAHKKAHDPAMGAALIDANILLVWLYSFDEMPDYIPLTREQFADLRLKAPIHMWTHTDEYLPRFNGVRIVLVDAVSGTASHLK